MAICASATAIGGLWGENFTIDYQRHIVQSTLTDKRCLALCLKCYGQEAGLPGEAGSDMKAVHILADEVLEVAGPLQAQEGHRWNIWVITKTRGVQVLRPLRPGGEMQF
ncbi:hypothetical protein EYF80_011628 [Liparis tanakae]|uniref:Uncharacterized protein n=1 Tax=Liparis tanakae TaxID=230148 RepID=A0A4Z2ILT2_9TELE|nr:hypothetical protein EYF80_011628 [Liparis tanakae]